VQIENRKYEAAYVSFDGYEKALPGNPNTVYFKGLTLDRQTKRKPAEEHYFKYLQQAPNGEYSKTVKDRLRFWGHKIPGEQV
jgi:hypothetical protein